MVGHGVKQIEFRCDVETEGKSVAESLNEVEEACWCSKGLEGCRSDSVLRLVLQSPTSSSSLPRVSVE